MNEPPSTRCIVNGIPWTDISNRCNESGTTGRCLRADTGCTKHSNPISMTHTRLTPRMQQISCHTIFFFEEKNICKLYDS